jgi:citrate synthase
MIGSPLQEATVLSVLAKKLEEAIPRLREERKALLEQRAGDVVSEVTVAQVVGGMRGVPGLVCDTSVVDPEKGLIIRGIPVAQLADRLPEEVYYLLLTGELPDAGALTNLQSELGKRAEVSETVWRVLDAMPADAHPMTMLSTALMAMESHSTFRRRYEKGMQRDDHWQAALDDSLTILAVLPELAAGIYRKRYGVGARIPRNPAIGWAANLAHMLGSNDERFRDYIRLATVVQSDHEGGHASALTAHTVGSVLSNVYLALSAGYNALAGPLHGLASQVCLEWVLEALNRYDDVPSPEQISEYTRETLAAGRVIPGYGHAVLRAQDPRYLAILAFGEQHTSRSPVFKTVKAMSRTIPGILMETGKVKNPWPNVDAINGALFHHFGITQPQYYTVFFAVALSFGISAQYILNRALGTPIMRPRSVTTRRLQDGQ